MKHTKTIVTLGIIVALLPFLGFPSSWKNIMFLILGAGIAALAFRMYTETRTKTRAADGEEFSSYKQSAMPDADISVAHE
ncbi:hypothetical protein JXR01_01920 [Candidatus Kaiserbacteria bacterium]|nr:MAG: hypothetical protein JXR01_01920 [Candidatus Kaiserbacteria bacterium]